MSDPVRKPVYGNMCPGCRGDAFFDKTDKVWRHVNGRTRMNWDYGLGCEERRGTKPDRRKL